MNIVVLTGGNGTEREVSLNSGRMIYEALIRKGHKTILLDVYLGYIGSASDIFKKDDKGIDFTLSENIGTRKFNVTDTGYFGKNVIEICRQCDIVFLGLHGENGENGKLQATFDLLGIRYTGADYLSSAICMNKGIAKEIFSANGIPTPNGVHIKKGEQVCKALPDFPRVVKAMSGGSSVGVSIVNDESQYQSALDEIFKIDDEIEVEEYIKGREFSVGIIDKKALPVIEIAPKEGFYDYKNKYQPGAAVETCPADLPKETADKMQKIAEEAYAALRLKVYARLDFLMKDDGSIYCLEANTIPGMTKTSLLPQEAMAVGVDFDGLCEWIVRVSMDK